MDREEALRLVIEPDAGYDYRYALVDSLVALGLLTFSEPSGAPEATFPRDEAAVTCNSYLQRAIMAEAQLLSMRQSSSGDEGRPVECWRGDRKVTVYKDEVLRVWGANMDTEMSSEPATLEAVQSAFDWLYGAAGQGALK